MTEDIIASCIKLMHQQQYAEADAVAQEGLAVHSGHALLWQLHGTARAFMGDVVTACSALEVAETLGALQPVARCTLADCCMRLARSAKARDLYVSLLQDDRCPTALLPRVACGLGRMEEYWLALQVCRRLARSEPTHHPAYFGMAFYMSRMAYPPECYLRHLHWACQLAPDFLHYRVNLVSLLAELGQIEQAHELLRPISAESIPCVCWLLRFVCISELANDQQLASTFRQQLTKLQGESLTG